MAQRYRALVTPGLEALLESELRSGPVKRLKRTRGAVEFTATRRGLYHVLHKSRLAGSVHWIFAEGLARDPTRLRHKLRGLPWAERLSGVPHLHLRARLRSPLFAGTGELLSLFQNVLEETLPSMDTGRPLISTKGAPPAGALGILIYLEGREYKIRIDVGGGRLDQRGWRSERSAAPLRATYAAALLAALNWHPGRPLIDPLCGSGTILIEAARIAARKSPRLSTYRPAALRLPDADHNLWTVESQRLADLSRSPWAPDTHSPVAAMKPILLGRDRSATALQGARRHAAAAEVETLISFDKASVDRLCASALLHSTDESEIPSGVVLANAPYGQRISAGRTVETLVLRYAAALPGWSLGLLLAQKPPPPPAGFVRREVLHFHHGGLPVKLWLFEGKEC
ncbi:MAG: hypothetical protein VYD19_02865 [Myxococcota bacterium]|nr:hypothetical protein [Myxococcota bacterium]